MAFFGLFGKKEKLGYYLLVDFSEEAKDNAQPYNFLKKIYHMQNGYVVDVENYTDMKVNLYKRKKIPVHDLTQGQLVPKESMLTPKEEHIMGQINLKAH